MPWDPDPVERARIQRELEELSARRSHPAYESNAPEAFPPPVVVDRRPGAGNPSDPPPAHKRIGATKEAFLGVWGVLAVIFGAAAAGWTAHVFFAEPLIAATVKKQLEPIAADISTMKNIQETNQRAVETSLAAIGTDLVWLKHEQGIASTQPIKPEHKK